MVYPTQVRRITPIKGHRCLQFELVLGDGQLIRARRVILATGGGNPQFPNWTNKITNKYPADQLVHSSQVDLRHLNLAGENILVVGGGLTSGHLAIGAIARGARVLLMARRQFQEKLFDTDPGWLGPKYLKGFSDESDWHRRREIIQEARNGGSLTPAIMQQLRRSASENKIRLLENCQVREARWQKNQWQINCENHEQYMCDRIWLATGTQLDAAENPLLEDLFTIFPSQLVGGLPVLDGYLRLPKTELFIMGGLAGLQLGPTARNLAGGIRASRCLVKALIKPSLAVA